MSDESKPRAVSFVLMDGSDVIVRLDQIIAVQMRSGDVIFHMTGGRTFSADWRAQNVKDAVKAFEETIEYVE